MGNIPLANRLDQETEQSFDRVENIMKEDVENIGKIATYLKRDGSGLTTIGNGTKCVAFSGDIVSGKAIWATRTALKP